MKKFIAATFLILTFSFFSLHAESKDPASADTNSLPESPSPTADSTSKVTPCSLAFLFYRKFITNQDIPGCRFSPSCSEYMETAIHKHGPAGIIMGLDRIQRCTKSESKRNLYRLDKNGLQIDPVP